MLGENYSNDEIDEQNREEEKEDQDKFEYERSRSSRKSGILLSEPLKTTKPRIKNTQSTKSAGDFFSKIYDFMFQNPILSAAGLLLATGVFIAIALSGVSAGGLAVLLVLSTVSSIFAGMLINNGYSKSKQHEGQQVYMDKEMLQHGLNQQKKTRKVQSADISKANNKANYTDKARIKDNSKQEIKR